MTEPMPDTHDFGVNGDFSHPDRLHDEVGQFFYYEGTFEAAVNAAKSGSGITPFRFAKLGGTYDWETQDYHQEREDWGKDEITLHNKWNKQDGRIKLEVKAGWQVAMIMQTDNNDFFKAEAQSNYVEYDAVRGPAPFGAKEKLILLEGEPANTVSINALNQFTNSEAVFVMNGDTGDYLSVDIDGNDKTIAQMAVRLDGTKMFQNTNPNNEVTLRMIWARVWDGDYPSYDELANTGDSGSATPPISENEDLEEEEEQGGGGQQSGGGQQNGGGGDEPEDEPLTPEYGLLYLVAGIVVVGLMVKYTRGA